MTLCSLRKVWMVDMKNLASKSLGLEGIRMDTLQLPHPAAYLLVSLGSVGRCTEPLREAALKTSWMDMDMTI